MHLNSLTEQWFIRMTAGFESGVRLFCVPNAGGGPALFRTWAKDLPAQVGVFPVILPGQASRLREPVPTQIQPLVNDLCEALQPYLNEPFALFGYSMGALVAFELARNLRQRGLPQPKHLFVAARRAPQTADSSAILHQLPDGDFVQGIQARYGGIPATIMQDAEMMALFTPVLRANFTMIETYQYNQEAPFDFPITAFGGSRDRTTSEAQLKAWGEHTETEFTDHVYEGDHFFIQQHQSAVLEHVASSLMPFISS